MSAVPLVPARSRSRLVYISLPDRACARALANGFLMAGFQVSLLPDPGALLRLAGIRRPDLVLLPLGEADATGQPALAAIQSIRALHLSIPIYVLAPEAARAELVAEAIKAGAGYAFSPPYTAAGIALTAERLLYATGTASAGPNPSSSPRQGFGMLSRRERQILKFIVEGRTNKEIALAVGISYRTVEVHRRSLCSKTGARNTAELVRLAVEG